jgi:hypothetical protein
MRRLLLPLLSLTACGSQTAVESNGAAAPAAGEPDNRIDCRPEGQAAFTHSCTVERADRILTIRKADGGFRRLRLTADGTGVAAADGAEPAIVTIAPDRRILVEIGGDRFLLPARIQAR